MTCAAVGCGRDTHCRHCGHCATHCRCVCRVNHCTRKMICVYCMMCNYHCTCSDVSQFSDRKVEENVQAWIAARNSSSSKGRPEVQNACSLRPRDEQRIVRARMAMKVSKYTRMVTDLPFRSSLYNYHGSTYIGMGAMDKRLCYLVAEGFFEGYLKPTGNRAVPLLYKHRKLREGAREFETAPIQVLVMCEDARVEGIRKVGSVNLGSPSDESVPVISQGGPSDVSFLQKGQVVVIADRDIVASVNDVVLVSRLTPYQESFGHRERGEYSELMADLKVASLETNVTVSELDIEDEDVEFLAFLRAQHSRSAMAMLQLNLDQREYKIDGNYLCVRHGVDIGSIPGEDYEIIAAKVLREQLQGGGNAHLRHWRFSGRSAFEVQERLHMADRLIGKEVDVQKVAGMARISRRDVLLALDDGRWGIASPDTACYSPLANRGKNGRRFRPLSLAEVIGVTVLADADGHLRDRLGRPLQATGSQGCVHLVLADGSEQARFDETMWCEVEVNGRPGRSLNSSKRSVSLPIALADLGGT